MKSKNWEKIVEKSLKPSDFAFHPLVDVYTWVGALYNSPSIKATKAMKKIMLNELNRLRKLHKKLEKNIIKELDIVDTAKANNDPEIEAYYYVYVWPIETVFLPLLEGMAKLIRAYEKVLKMKGKK